MTQLLVPAAKPAVARADGCASCKFAVRVGGGAECRRNPPTTFLISTPQGPKGVGAWPPVAADQFCGEYKPKLIAGAA